MSHAPTPSGPAVDSAPPVALAGYRDFELVAKGGDSLVFRAVQEGLDRRVAVKVLAVGDSGVPPARYQRELEITVRLGQAHPNIVTVFATEILGDGRPCIIMPYYELGSLQDQLRAHGRLPASAAVAACTVVADALAFAHGEGVLHRDVKPANILVLPTSYVLADFGLARRIDAGHTASLERFSYRHASPQVLDGELPTVADDIYSLGSTLYTLLDGRPPFAADPPDSDSALAYLRRARSDPPRPIRSSDATPELLELVDRCLAKRREDRFPDARTLLDTLRSVVTEGRVWAKPWQPEAFPGPRPAPPADVPAPAPADVPAPPPADAPRAAPPDAPTVPGSPRVPVPVPPPSPYDTVTAQVPLGTVHRQWTDVPGEAYDDAADDGNRGRDGPPRRWPRVLLLTGLTLVAGAGIGRGATWVAAELEAGQDPDVRLITSYAGELPAGAPSLAVDPALAPEITAISWAGASIELAWTDPSGGAAEFVVIQVGGFGEEQLLHVGAGTTAVTVPVPGPDAATCFRVLALRGTAMGVSPLRCADQPAG